MIFEKEKLGEILREQRKLLQKERLEKEFRRLNRLFKKELEAEIYLYSDSCPEFYEGIFYVAEVIEKKKKELIYTCVRPDIKGILKELEGYINE